MLFIKLQAGLQQLSSHPASLSPLEAHQSIYNSTQDRAFHYGVHAYHRIMNEHLDRQAIPLPWHTLAMFHYDAQSKALEEIEKRYFSIGHHLPKLLREFRSHCLETTAVGADSVMIGSSATTSTSALEVMVPTGGLYLEYYTANASALQSHHLITLDENWQLLLKSRLLSVQSTNNAMSSTILSPPALVPSRPLPEIKDYTDFLLAVDQVRRGYIETCIPSPEAISVLENLDEMQQAESVIFLKSIAVTTPSSATPTHLRRSSISSSARQSLIISSSDVLTDTLSGRRTSIQALASASGINIGGVVGAASGAANGVQALHQQIETLTELDQQIAEIMQAKRRAKLEGQPINQNSLHHRSSKEEDPVDMAKVACSSKTGTLSTTGSNVPVSNKESDNKAVVQFGWTLHMLHANTLHKMYTASKWIILPAKDLVHTRKDWKVSYGDRVWLVSYWFSTRNAKMDLPEYLQRARGAPCRHVIPYGETYVICKTCPADILCMRCFRDHTMYLQCSWGTSVCVCGDPQRLKANNALHCSLHCAESQRSYSRLAKGKPCQIKFKAGEKVYRCKSCATEQNQNAVLCDRCFRSHNHFGHDVVAQIADAGLICSCCDGESWNPDTHCTYHSPGLLGVEYLPRPITIPPPYLSPWARLPLAKQQESSLIRMHSASSVSSAKPSSASVTDSHCPSSPATAAAIPHRCGHIFQAGEDIYHCRDCSFNDMVVLCSRCFHNSGCMNHRWRMGAFQIPVVEPERSKTSSAKRARRQNAGKAVSKEHGEYDSDSTSVVIDSLDVMTGDSCDASHDTNHKPLPKLHPVEVENEGGDCDGEGDDDLEDVEPEEPVHRASCDCGNPEMFKTAFDCSYHLPQEFRPVPNLIHCNYLFQRNETMFRCKTCYLVDVDVDDDGDESSSACGSIKDSCTDFRSDIWICARCFDPEDHSSHDIEEVINVHNEGLYCHCGDPTILRHISSTSSAANSTESCAATAPASSTVVGGGPDCRDDHNRQNILCTTDIKEGMFYYCCKTCQTDSTRIFCESCFVKEAHEDHSYQRLSAPSEFKPTTCGCGENSAFRFATHCQQHERAGGTNIVHRCRYRACAGEWIAFCSDCYPPQDGLAPPYLCLRCRQGSDHTGHEIKWIKIEQDMLYPCACGSHTLSRLATESIELSPTATEYIPSVSCTMASPGTKSPTVANRNSIGSSGSSCETPSSRPTSKLSASSSRSSSSSPKPGDKGAGNTSNRIKPPPLCQYHTMIYKTTPSTTLFLHSHNYRSINHQDHNEVTGFKYHDSNNDWIVCRPGEGTGGEENTQQQLSPYLQWKDVYWLKHVNTGKYFNSMASLKISQGFQEVSALESPHSNNDWIIEETTWLRQQILSDE
ncbi:hypothetical protein BGX27_009762 [Mortierella sp. AM989]|nr:hypothetical protein BGX27_009762 [Mortierella sp. AM989]